MKWYIADYPWLTRLIQHTFVNAVVLGFEVGGLGVDVFYSEQHVFHWVIKEGHLRETKFGSNRCRGPKRTSACWTVEALYLVGINEWSPQPRVLCNLLSLHPLVPLYCKCNQWKLWRKMLGTVEYSEDPVRRTNLMNLHQNMNMNVVLMTLNGFLNFIPFCFS